jgi:hypothetical protein
LLWILSLLQELKLSVSKSPTLWCDNLRATFLASNPVFHARTKHIELDYHFVREKVANRHLIVKFIRSADQIGDVFTKSLAKKRFKLLCDKLHIFPNMSRLRGAVEGAAKEQLDISSTSNTGEDEEN